MSSSTPGSPAIRKDQHNPHSYPIKTSHTGLLTRSNSSKAHGSWSKHHYTPVPPSPSARVFDAPDSGPSATRRPVQSSSHMLPLQAPPSSRSHKHENTQESQRSESVSPSPSKYSRSWMGRNSEGKQVNLPRHPYLWNPAQLASYLSFELYGNDGEALDSDVVKLIVEYIQQRKIGGRAFLNLDREDFQEMEGIDSRWSNALWDASSTLRQGIAPYRPSRISSSAYKRGRVRGVVDFFERSTSESSDIGEDEAQNISRGKVVLTGGPSCRRHPRKTPTPKRDMSEAEHDLQEHTISNREPNIDVGTSTAHNVILDINPQISSSAHIGLDLYEHPSQSPASPLVVEDNLAVVIPPRSDTPIDVVLGLDEFQYRAMHSSELGLQGDNTRSNSREVEIVPLHPREISEPTMAELYEQTYGVLAPSLGSGHPVHQVPSVDEPQSETVKIVAAATSSSDSPPTVLRPVVRRRAVSPPRSLRHLFIPSSVIQTASNMESQSVSVLPTSDPRRDETACRTLIALKERLAIVEQRLEAMEVKDDAKATVSHHTASFCSTAGRPRRPSIPSENDLGDSDLQIHSSRSAEALRSWQSAYILLAGATTGVSVVVIPMLLRHLWSR